MAPYDTSTHLSNYILDIIQLNQFDICLSGELVKLYDVKLNDTNWLMLKDARKHGKKLHLPRKRLRWTYRIWEKRSSILVFSQNIYLWHMVVMLIFYNFL